MGALQQMLAWAGASSKSSAFANLSQSPVSPVIRGTSPQVAAEPSRYVGLGTG